MKSLGQNKEMVKTGHFYLSNIMETAEKLQDNYHNFLARHTRDTIID